MVVGIAGGIGSGKSMVSRILRLRGFEVYDSDVEAKRIMDSSDFVKDGLCAVFGSEAVDAETRIINRGHIAAVAFGDTLKLQALNDLVHSQVRSDLQERIKRMRPGETLFVESAILFSSGLERFCDKVLLITAPSDLRVARASRRDLRDKRDIEKRVAAQICEEKLAGKSSKVAQIVNDDFRSVLLQLNSYVKTQN